MFYSGTETIILKETNKCDGKKDLQVRNYFFLHKNFDLSVWHKFLF